MPDTVVDIDSSFDNGLSIFTIILCIVLFLFLSAIAFYMWRVSRGTVLSPALGVILFFIDIVMIFFFLILIILAIVSFSKRRRLLLRTKPPEQHQVIVHNPPQTPMSQGTYTQTASNYPAIPLENISPGPAVSASSPNLQTSLYVP